MRVEWILCVFWLCGRSDSTRKLSLHAIDDMTHDMSMAGYRWLLARPPARAASSLSLQTRVQGHHASPSMSAPSRAWRCCPCCQVRQQHLSELLHGANLIAGVVTRPAADLRDHLPRLPLGNPAGPQQHEAAAQHGHHIPLRTRKCLRSCCTPCCQIPRRLLLLARTLPTPGLLYHPTVHTPLEPPHPACCPCRQTQHVRELGKVAARC
jgi:hypothetical protein